MVRVLFLGEVVGIPTIKALEQKLKDIIRENSINFTIANADGASDGYGILRQSAIMLSNSGINVVTCGDSIYNKKDFRMLLKLKFLLRPFNLPSTFGGKGYYIFSADNDIKIGVISMLGRTGFHKIFPMDPFYSIEKAIEKLSNEVKIILVDFHGGTTSEIQAMQWYLAGRVSLVAGTHLRVLTADNRIINDKTAVITNTGYCGGYYSIGGLEPKIEIDKIKNGQFSYSKVSKELITLQGVVVEIDEETGNALSIELFKEKIS